MLYPSEAQRQAAIFEHRYHLYVARLTQLGRVPASRDVILEEARRGTLSAIDVLNKKLVHWVP